MIGKVWPGRGIAVACDVESFDTLKELVEATMSIPEVRSYRIGFMLACRYGLRNVSEVIRGMGAGQRLVYDNQNANIDTPELAEAFANVVAEAEVDTAVILPFAGPDTLDAWIYSLRDQDIEVIMGIHMTQEKFLFSRGGYIADSVLDGVYICAADRGVRQFIAPGNELLFLEHYRVLLEGKLHVGNFSLFLPGFAAQGGSISKAGKRAGDNWEAVVDVSFWGPVAGLTSRKIRITSIRKAAERFASQII